MQRLSGMDASFIYMETPSLHMHVVGVLVLDPAGMATGADGFSFEHFRDVIGSRFHVMPGFRQKLRQVPLGIDHPVWVDDPDFDLDHHLNHSALPAPGSMHQLADLVGRIASYPLERDRPLWRMWVVEGLEDGNVALISKIHHATMDGVTGSDLIAHLFDFEPEVTEVAAPLEPWEPGPEPSSLALTRDAVMSRATNPLRTARAVVRTGRSLTGMAMGALGIGTGRKNLAVPFSSPRTSFNRTLSHRRVVAFGQGQLDDLRHIKSTFGTTVNDVVLAACTMSLRRYLRSVDDLPDRPLLCSVPVSVHGEGAADGTNQVSNMFVRLPVHLDDPVDQLRAVREDTRDAKEMQQAMGADLIQDLAQMTPPGVFNLASRLYSGTGLAEQLPPVHNLIISNVPGPPVPLYIAGARVVGIYPFGPLLEAGGINITVLSNMGNLDVGVIACPDVVTDVWAVVEGFDQAIAELVAAADKHAGSTGSDPN